MRRCLLGSRWESGVWKEEDDKRSTPEDLCGGERSFEKTPPLEFRGWERALGRLKEEELEGEDRVADSKSSPELCLLACCTSPTA